MTDLEKLIIITAEIPTAVGPMGSMEKVRLDLTSFLHDHNGVGICVLYERPSDGNWFGIRVELLHKISDPQLYQEHLQRWLKENPLVRGNR